MDAGMQILKGRWQTAAARPYFANLKVMRRVLGALRAALREEGGDLLGYLFFEECLLFLVSGPDGAVAAALQLARDGAEEEFRASDRKPLWGAACTQPVSDPDLNAALDELLRAPMGRGLAQKAGDYPWCGGRLLSARLDETGEP